MNRLAELQQLIDQKAELIQQLKYRPDDLELTLRLAYVQQEIKTFKEQRLTISQRTLSAVQRILNA